MVWENYQVKYTWSSLHYITQHANLVQNVCKKKKKKEYSFLSSRTIDASAMKNIYIQWGYFRKKERHGNPKIYILHLEFIYNKFNHFLKLMVKEPWELSQYVVRCGTIFFRIPVF